MMMLTLGLLVLSLSLYFYFTKPKNVHLPGPRNLPLIGSLHLLNSKQPYLSLHELAKTYGDIYRFKFGLMDAVIVSNANLMRKILLRSESLSRPPMYLVERILQYKGLVFADGELWKDQRKFVTKFFNIIGATRNSPNKEYMMKILSKNANNLIKSIRSKGDEVRVMPFDVFIPHVTSSIKNLLTGTDESKDEKFWKDFVSDIESASKHAALGGHLNFIPFLRFIPWINDAYYQLEKLRVSLNKFVKILINETLKSTSNSPNIVKTFLQEKNGRIYNNDQLEHLYQDLYSAGIETTLTSLIWIICFLTEHQHVQEKMRNEIEEVVKKKPLQFNDLEKLHFTQATLSEIGRIRTVLPLGFPHYTSDDLHLDDVTVEKGTMIVPLLWAIHMDPENWDNPEEFRPERFLDEDGSYVKHEFFTPFQSGKRVCIGEDIAKTLATVFTVEIVRTFQVLKNCNEGLDFVGECGVTLIPKRQNILFKRIK